MTSLEGNPKEREYTESENRKYGRLTMALGLAAVIGSFFIPSHDRPLNELRAGLSIGGLAVMVKGMAQTLRANERLED